MKKLRRHAAKAGGVLKIFYLFVVVNKLRRHAAKAGGVLRIFYLFVVVNKLKLHAAKAGGVVFREALLSLSYRHLFRESVSLQSMLV